MGQVLTLVKQKISFAVPTPTTFSSLFGYPIIVFVIRLMWALRIRRTVQRFYYLFLPVFLCRKKFIDIIIFV